MATTMPGSHVYNTPWMLLLLAVVSSRVSIFFVKHPNNSISRTTRGNISHEFVRSKATKKGLGIEKDAT